MILTIMASRSVSDSPVAYSLISLFRFPLLHICEAAKQDIAYSRGSQTFISCVPLQCFMNVEIHSASCPVGIWGPYPGAKTLWLRDVEH